MWSNLKTLYRRLCQTPNEHTRRLAQAPLQPHYRQEYEIEALDSRSFTHQFRRSRADAITNYQACIHLRGHDETEARRRAGALAGWQMGRLRLRRRRSGSEHQDFAFVDRASERSRGRGTAVKSNSESRGTPAVFAGRK